MNKNTIVLIIVAITLILAYSLSEEFLSVGAGTSFYVSNSGNDSFLGTSPETAWKTISKVNSEFGNTIQIGDSIYFKCGDSFTDDSLKIRTGGTPTNLMTFSSYGVGDKPNFNKLIQCYTTGIGNIIVENLDIGPISTRNSLIFNQAGVTNIIIRNVDIHDADLGIFLTCIDTYLIEDCHIYDILDNAFTIYGNANGEITNGIIQNCVATNVGEGFTIHGSDQGHPIGPHHYLINCKSIDIFGEDAYDLVSGDDIQMINCETQTAPRGIAIGHEVTNVLIDGYKGDDTSSFGIFIGNSNGITIKNSVVTNAGTDTVRMYEHAGMDVENVEIHNCVFVDKPDVASGRSLLRIGYGGDVGYENNINVHDNVFISYRVGELVAYTSDSTPDNTNSQYSNNIWWQTSGSSNPIGRVSGVGNIAFSWWQDKFPTDTFQDPVYCTEPFGASGNTICGDPEYGQDPTHLYECQCVGDECHWEDLGYNSQCDGEPPVPPDTPGFEFILVAISLSLIIIWRKRKGRISG